MWQGQFALITLYEQIGNLLFYLGDLILKHVMCVMRESRNLSTYVKVTKNGRESSCRIIINNFFHNLSK